MRSQITPTWGISELVRALEGFPRGSVVKNPRVSVGDASSIPGSGRSPGEGNGSILPEKSREQVGLAGYSPWDCKSRTDLVTEQQQGP